MGRANYVETIQKADAGTNIARTLAGVAVNVYLRGTSTPAVIFSDPVTNVEIVDQIITGDDGLVNFWADAGSFDIAYSDTLAPQRIADYVVGWEASPMSAGSIPGSVLTDGSVASAKLINLLLAQLAPEIERQLIPVGQVIDWWRPNDTYPLPSGFEIADGHPVAADSHDFDIVGPVNTPDLRNLFVIGADSAKANGAAGTLADGSANAPGIGRLDGHHQHTLIAAESGTNASGSTDNDGAHVHQIQGVGVSAGGGGIAWTDGVDLASHFQSTDTFSNPSAHTHSLAGRDADNAHNNVPRYVGLLKLIKVRQA